LSPDTAIAPVIGADVNVFFWRSIQDGSTFTLSPAQWNSFIYAGLQGRFDLGGHTQPRTVVTVPAAASR
jgi:hypothetical protein